MTETSLALFALEEIPLVEPGDDLAALLAHVLRSNDVSLRDGDVLVVAQKIVSKAEGRYVDLSTVQPSDRARDLAQRTGKDPRHVEVILRESEEIVKVGDNVIIAAHLLGFVMANAGVDESNIPAGHTERVLLLPRDPDAAALQLKVTLDAAFDVTCGVIVNDSFGRPWRNGTVGVAIGAAGIASLLDRRGTCDLFGRALRVTEIAVADELASAASLLMGQGAEGRPAVLVRGLSLRGPAKPASALIRERERDLFR